MAYSNIIVGSLETHSNADIFSVTLPSPAGGIVNGDKIFVLLSIGASQGSLFTPPAGWVREQASSDNETQLLSITASGGEQGSVVNFDVESSSKKGISIPFVVKNWASYESVGFAENFDSNPNPPSITPSWGVKENTFIVLAGHSPDEATFNSPPTGYGNMVSGHSGSGNANTWGGAIAYKQAEIGTEDPGTFSLSQDEFWDAMTLVIEPLATTHTLTITSANGTVIKNPDKANYNNGEVVELTADPDPGWAFDSWSGDITSASNPVNVTMDADKNITANYVQTQWVSPEDGAVDVSTEPLLDARDFAGYDNVLFQLSSDPNFDTLLVDEIVSVSEYQVLSGILSTSTLYYARAFGVRVNFNTTIYNEDFAGIADGQPWPSPWTTADRAGNGNVSFDVTGERARIVMSGPSVVATADLDGIDIEDTTQTFLVRSNLISNNVQPSYLFRASGAWQGGKKVGYQFWFWDQKVHLVKTVDNGGTLENNILTEVAEALSADTDYMIKYQTNGSLIQWKIWDAALSEPSGWQEYDDQTNPILSGRFAIKLATTASAPGTTVVEFDDFDIQQAEDIPVTSLISVGDTEATFGWTDVANATAYEYRLDGGTEINLGDPDPNEHTVTGLTNGQQYSLETRAIVGGSATSWSNAIQFTPVADSIISVTIDQANADVQVGQTRQLTATVVTTGSPDTSLSWSSSDPGVTSVDQNGVIEGISEGSCLITATSVADGTKSDSVSSNVTQSTEPVEWFSDATIASNDSNLKDREALAKLYADCNGTNWDNQTGWSSDPAQIDLSAGNEPFGVEAQTINSERRVTLIRLNNNGTGDPENTPLDCQGNNLSGTLPNELGNLKQLVHFNVCSNKLIGNLPGGMRYCKDNLEVCLFELTTSDAPGAYNFHAWNEPLRPEVEQLSGESGKQRGFDKWSHNNFTGRLPGEYSDWNTIKQFACASTTIDSNGQAFLEGITGPLPPEWGQWTWIQQIFLDINEITGKLPPEWAGMVENVDLYLNVNRLGSTTVGDPDAVLPSAWGGGEGYGGGMRKLRHFSINDRISGGSYSDYSPGGKSVINRFDGPVPENWGNMNMLHRYTRPKLNQQSDCPDFWSTKQWKDRKWQQGDWTGSHPDGSPTPNPDGDPIEAWALNLTEIKQINNMTSMPDFSNLDLSRFAAADLSNNFGGTQVPANLSTQTGMKQLFLAGTNLTGPFPDVTGWNQCKIFEIRSNNWGNGLPEVPGASGSEWRNVQAQFGGFSGSIPASWGNLPDTTWTRCWLHGNNLSGSIPSGMGGVTVYSDELRLDNNKFNFTELVLFLANKGTTSDVRYAPQKRLGSSQTYNRSVGQSLNVDPFSGQFTHGNNNYQWHKISGSGQGAVSGETNRALSLSNLQASDDGQYELRVENPGAPNLSGSNALKSQVITLNVS